MRSLACLALAALLPFTAHGAAERTWSMSGAELLQAILGQHPDGSAQPDAAAAQTRLQAQGYVRGVADGLAAHGKCSATRVLPHEQVARVYEQLKTLPAERLQGPATPLVAAALAC